MHPRGNRTRQAVQVERMGRFEPARAPPRVEKFRGDSPLPGRRKGGRNVAIEPASGAVVRISAALMGSMEDMGLKSLTADVR